MPESQYSISAVLSVGEANSSFATWNSSTALNSTAVLVNNDFSYNSIIVTLAQTSGITGGDVTFQASTDGSNWFDIEGFIPGAYSFLQGSTYALQPSIYGVLSFNLTAIPYFRILLDTVITGAGSVTLGYSADSFVNTLAIGGSVEVSSVSGLVNVSGSYVGITGKVSCENSYALNPSAATWNAATALNTVVQVAEAEQGNVCTIGISQAPTGTLTGGGCIFEATVDNVTWVPIDVVNASTRVFQGSSFTFTVATYTAFRCDLSGFFAVRVRLNPVILGTGVVYISSNVQGIGADGDPSLAAVSGVALGAPTTWGTAPSGNVIGANAGLFAGSTALTATGTSLNVNITGGGSGSTQYTDGTAESAGAFTITVAGSYNGTNVVGLRSDASDNLLTKINVALPAGTNVIGHVITDSGSTTAVTGTVAVTQSTSPWVVSLSSTTITGTVSVTQGTSPWVISGTDSDNAANSTAKVPVIAARANAAAPSWTEGHESPLSVDLSGNQRVILNAETTKVIGAVNQGTSPWVVSLSSTTITGTVSVTQGTTPWVVSGTDSDNAANSTAKVPTIPARANAAAPSWTEGHEVPLSTDLAGNLRVTLVSGSSTVVGSLTNNNAAPSSNNMGVLSALANAAAPTWTEGDQVLLSEDLSGNLRVKLGAAIPAGTNVIGHVITDSGSTTVVTGTVAVTQSTSPWVVSLTSTTITGTVSVTQGTSPWVVSGTDSDNAANSTAKVPVIPARANASAPSWTEGHEAPLSTDLSGSLRVNVTNTSIAVTGTFWQATQPVSIASAQVASGAFASGSIASGAIASGAVASGAIASGAAVSGAFASGAIVDLTNVTTSLAATAATKALAVSNRAATAYPTAVTDGQAVLPMADKAGRQAVVLNTVRDLVTTLILSNNSGSTAQNFGSAGGTGVFLDLTTFTATNRSSTASVVSLSDGTNTYTYAIASNGGIVVTFPTPLPAHGTATQWTVLNSAGVAFDYMAVAVQNK